MINVLFLETSLRIGGTETVITRLLERMDKTRFRPVLCCLYDAGVLGDKLIRSNPGITIHTGLVGSRMDFRIVPRLIGLLRKEKIDVLFLVNQPIIQFWGILCGVLAGVPVRIAAIRSTGKVNRIRRRLFINRLTFPWTTKVTALSQMHKQYLTKEEQIDPAQMEIVTNGVDMNIFNAKVSGEAVRKERGIRPGQPVVGIVAMLRPEKAHDVFLKAAADVVKQVPDAQFLIVGDGAEKPKLEAMVSELKLGANVHFLGSRQDIPAVLAAMDIAVLCSNPVVETLSNAVLEYMAMGKPVVATRVGSLPEQVMEGLTGFLVAPGDSAALGQQITKLLKDETLRKRMGQAAYDRVLNHYTIEQMVNQWQSLFERLLSQKR